MINTEKLPLLKTNEHINYNGINNSHISINHSYSSSTESIMVLDDDQITNARENNNLNNLLFEAKNYFHKEQLPENLYNNFWDILMSVTSGVTVMNLSYLNYKLISLKNKWKYLSFSLVIGGISIWDQFLYLYVSEENFKFISFIERISIFFTSISIEELIFDKIAQPCIEKLWQNLKNQNFSKIIKYGSTVSMLLFVSILKNILTGLYGEEKEINFENIKKALPLTLLTVILENTLTSFSFSYFDWF